ncbi:unnamed protein product, partial [Iphiclides podalirius]
MCYLGRLSGPYRLVFSRLEAISGARRGAARDAARGGLAVDWRTPPNAYAQARRNARAEKSPRGKAAPASISRCGREDSRNAGSALRPATRVRTRRRTLAPGGIITDRAIPPAASPTRASSGAARVLCITHSRVTGWRFGDHTGHCASTYRVSSRFVAVIPGRCGGASVRYSDPCATKRSMGRRRSVRHLRYRRDIDGIGIWPRARAHFEEPPRTSLASGATCSHSGTRRAPEGDEVIGRNADRMADSVMNECAVPVRRTAPGYVALTRAARRRRGSERDGRRSKYRAPWPRPGVFLWAFGFCVNKG